MSDLVRYCRGQQGMSAKSMLAAGARRADIDEREGQETVARAALRCRILLDARGVRPGTTDPDPVLVV